MENTMNLMATSRQLFALWLASGKAHDYRNDNLTKEQASKMLDEFNNKSGYQKTTKNVTAKKKESHKRIAKVVMNKFGVKVGDVFHMSWGYDQTNNDFFQVVALVGESSVRIREVDLNYTSENRGFMCEDRIFEIPQDGKMAKYHKDGIFTKDQEKGDIKRILTENSGVPYICMKNHYATKVSGKTFKHYESWYA